MRSADLRNLLENSKNIMNLCAKAKRGKFLKAPPAFMVTFSAKIFFHDLKSIYC